MGITNTLEECCKKTKPISTLLGRCYAFTSGSETVQNWIGETSGHSVILRDVTDLVPGTWRKVFSDMVRTRVEGGLIKKVRLGEGMIIWRGVEQITDNRKSGQNG